jgi:hypothetical protein
MLTKDVREEGGGRRFQSLSGGRLWKGRCRLAELVACCSLCWLTQLEARSVAITAGVCECVGEFSSAAMNGCVSERERVSALT